MSNLITNNLDFGTGDNYVLQDARVDSMYTNAQIDSALGNKVDKVSGKGLSTEDFTTAEKTKLTNLTRPNNSTITIRQGGVVKGTFTVDSAQDITIDIDAGGGSVDAYTKTESDNRFASKTYFDKDMINVDDSDYIICIGTSNGVAADNGIVIGESNYIRSSAGDGNILIGYFNSTTNYGGDYNVCIGSNGITSTYDYVTVIGSAWGTEASNDYEVLIGYEDKCVSVLPSGEVYSRGDVTCDDGSGGRISLRNLQIQEITPTSTVGTWSGKVIKIGKICYITGTLAMTSAVSDYTTTPILSGLPAPLANNALITCQNNNVIASTINDVLARISAGNIYARTNVSGSGSLRINGSWITS